jgi:YidC/Oxa1 family membrane protein insertase
MDSRRLIIFVVLSIGLLFIWDKYFAPKTLNNVIATNNSTVISQKINNDDHYNKEFSNKNILESIILVSTDLFQAKISTKGGDLVGFDLLNHGENNNSNIPFSLLTKTESSTYIVQTGLLGQNINLPSSDVIFSTNKLSYTLQGDQNVLNVPLEFNLDNGIKIIKNYQFKRDSYVVVISYNIINMSSNPLNSISAYWRILRDENAPKGQIKFTSTFTGPVYYDSDNKFNKISFKDISKNDFSYPENISNGWVGMIQHYFASIWLINAYGYKSVCDNGVSCRLNFKKSDNNLFSSGLITDLPVINKDTSYNISVPLFLGPQENQILTTVAPELSRVKDYGWVYIFATPLFSLLVKIHELLKNWGWAIIVLTIIVKAILYPLTRASYISMAKMKELAPKVEKLRKQYQDDKLKLQQSMMQLYKTEKVNPVGGCLPMILQIPVFIGLYWALFSSVELRQAHFLWIKDLSLPDPFYILPILLAITMVLQTFMNPPPADPVQAKMMKIMPLLFSIMFFFFPAGLVIYWLVNNILSILQQWYVNKHVTLKKINRIK